MTVTAVRAYVTANRQRMWGWVAVAILGWAGITGLTVRQPGGAVMVSVSWGSKGEVNATRPCLCFSGGQEKHRKGRGGQRGGGMRTWKEKRETGESVWEFCLLRTHLDTPARGHTATHTRISCLLWTLQYTKEKRHHSDNPDQISVHHGNQWNVLQP